MDPLLAHVCLFITVEYSYQFHILTDVTGDGLHWSKSLRLRNICRSTWNRTPRMKGGLVDMAHLAHCHLGFDTWCRNGRFETHLSESDLLDGSRVTHVKWVVTKRHQRDQLSYSSAMVAHARRRPNGRRSLCWISWTLIQVNWHREDSNHFFTETVMVFEIGSADIWWWWRRRAWRW